MQGWTMAAVVALAAATAPALAEDAPVRRPTGQFAALDADQDGKVTAAELRAVRERQVAQFDRDGDGRLSETEYQAWWLTAARERFLRQFRADDRDQDGAVSLDELVERADALLQRRDRDRDGAISREEWRPVRRVAAYRPT